MKKKKLSKSIRKYIRKEKARMRQEILDVKLLDKQIQEIGKNFLKKKSKKKLKK